ncbi:MAG: glycosyltransferase [Lachnospiraceae bacterium]|nr:glycosyltransferase [Lachnospiraceae bacterium]
MVVTIVSDVLGEENNGTTVACMNLIRYLKSCGDTVKVICPDKNREGQDGFYIVKPLNLGFIINKIVKKNNVTIAKPDKRIIRAAIEGSDVVHIMMPFPVGNCAAAIAHELGIPVTAGFHCQAENFSSHILMFMNSDFFNRMVYKHFYKKLYSNVTMIHYPTQFIRDLFEKTVGHKTNGIVISNGVNEAYKYAPTVKPDRLKDFFLILFTGRYAKEKSHTILVKAVGCSKYKDKIKLIFAGSGPRRSQILRAVRKADIPMPIMKFFTRKQLARVINYSDLYCHPAEIEIEAIACLEAISCGLVPIINNSPRCATKAFALDERSLFKCNDYRDLANKIDFFIEHDDVRQEYSKRYLASPYAESQKECMIKMRRMLSDAILSEKQ